MTAFPPQRAGGCGWGGSSAHRQLGRELMRSNSARLLVALCSCAAAAVFGAGSADAGGAQNVPVSGTGGPQTGPFTPSGASGGLEFPGGSESDEAPGAGSGVVDRSLSRGNGKPVS